MSAPRFESIAHDLLTRVSGGLMFGDGGCVPPRPRPRPLPPNDWPLPRDIGPDKRS